MKIAGKKMKIQIDGRELTVDNIEKNIVEVASQNGINILAPCFRSKRKHGCCNTCLIEIDGEEKFACVTKPEDGMNIIYDREDLSIKRKQRLENYANKIKSGEDNPCSCSSDSSNSGSCGCDCDGC